MNPIVIVLQTYERTEYAIRTVHAIHEHLICDRDVYWYVADDGSEKDHVLFVHEALAHSKFSIAGSHSERLGYGGSANNALDFLYEYGIDIALWLEDDWELLGPLRLDWYIKLLEERSDIGMIRLGYLNSGIQGHITTHDAAFYLSLDHEPIASEQHQIAFTGHPSLRHRRYDTWYGRYREGLVPGDTELDYAYQYRTRVGGPRIVWPLAYPPHGMFGHIGAIKTETLL